MSIWDDLVDVVEDVVDAVEDVAGGLVQAGADVFGDVAPLAGLLTSGAALFIAGPAYLVPAFAAGVAGSKLLVRHRPMTARERRFAEAVFGSSLPPNDRIVLTNLSGLKGAKFVVPSINGKIWVNLGPTCYDHPLTYEDRSYPRPGKVFIHELVHVWQIHHGSYFPRICDRVVGEIGGVTYQPPADLRAPWPALSLEQEATVVDEWFAPTAPKTLGLGMQASHPYFQYVNEVICKGTALERVGNVDIYGAIVVKWRRLGGLAGFLGAPVSAEGPASDGTGRLQRFAGGVIAWHPKTGAFSVRGAILQRWLAIGDVRFGYPTTDELATPDRAGRFNHFQQTTAGLAESSIYWTAGTGAVEVYGAIRRHWAALGWEQSPLRYPLAPEEAAGVDRKQRFGGGVLVWRRNVDKVEQLPHEQFIGRFSTVRVEAPSWFYTVSDSGVLTWRALRAQAPRRVSSWQRPRNCGTGWNGHRHVVPGGGASIYLITQEGSLRWYRHDGFNNGAFQWTGGHHVNAGWQIFERVIGGGNGVLYGIQPDGTLRWYKDRGYLSGSSEQTVTGGAVVGSGWTMYAHVFSGGDGVLYGVDAAGDLYWYRHAGFQDGAATWIGRTKVGGGWGDFVSIHGAGEGVVFALLRDGRLLRYQHRGWQSGGGMETWTDPIVIATGLKNMERMFAMLPSTDGPVVH